MILSKMDKINNDSFNFVILYSARDCFNCLEMEIPILNEMQNKDNVSVYGYYSKEKDSYLIDRITELLPPMFPISTLDSLVVDQIITPTILVLKSQKENTLLLDAHVPIPNDLDRTKEFYQKWNRIIDNS